MTAPVRVGLLGCGTVGTALVELLAEESATIAARSGLGLELARVATRGSARPRPHGWPAGAFTTDALAVVTDPTVDVVVELIGGMEPAGSLVRKALEAGKPVVTANKELLAHAGPELHEVAAGAGVDLLYEGAVAGAIPLIRPLRESLAGERILRVMGIVNGTTNYILTRMSEDGVSYGDALAEAQSLGYAEANPTADVEGHDAAAKAAILASIAFGADVVATDVYREGISQLGTADLAFARRLGYEVKLLAVAERAPRSADGGREGTQSGPAGASPAGASPAGGSGSPAPGWPGGSGRGAPAEPSAVPGIAVRVHPTMVPMAHPLASVRDAFNAVFIEGEAVGELMLYGRGAGGRPTAAAVLGDLIDAAHNLRSGGRGRVAVQGRARVVPMAELRCQYYVSIDVVDRPGVLAAVAGVFGSHSVSIRSMEQVGLGAEARLIFITHTACEQDMQDTVDGLAALDAVERVGGLLRLVGTAPP